MQLALIRESDIRSKLVRKLSEANQQIRQLKKEVQISLQLGGVDCKFLHSSLWEVTNFRHYFMQVQEKDDKMFRCRSELASMELELQVWFVHLILQEMNDI
jgi:hypothetical protein